MGLIDISVAIVVVVILLAVSTVLNFNARLTDDK